jgi:hypothetical protein
VLAQFVKGLGVVCQQLGFGWLNDSNAFQVQAETCELALNLLG